MRTSTKMAACAATLSLMSLCANATLVESVPPGTSWFFAGPTTPSGVPCDPTHDLNCISGLPIEYQVFSMEIDKGPGLEWTIKIDTNYPITIPPGSTAAPTFQSGLGMAGWLVTTPDGREGGITLKQGTSYAPGGFYEATNGFLTSGQVMAPLPSPHADQPVELAPGGTSLGDGTVEIDPLGNGITGGLYMVTISVSIPDGWIMPGSRITSSSYDCFNGSNVVPELPPPPEITNIPEPAPCGLTWLGLLSLVAIRRLKS